MKIKIKLAKTKYLPPGGMRSGLLGAYSNIYYFYNLEEVLFGPYNMDPKAYKFDKKNIFVKKRALLGVLFVQILEILPTPPPHFC